MSTLLAPSLSASSRLLALSDKKGAPLQRHAPQNIEVEQALLGAILLNNNAFDRVSDFLKPEHFAEEIHRRIYDVITQTIRKGRTADPVTVKTFLGDHQIGDISTSEYLAHLAISATSIINAPDYGRLIYDLSMRRSLITIGEDIVTKAYDSPVDADPRQQIEQAEQLLYRVAEQGRTESGFQNFSSAITTAIDMAAKAYERDGKLSGVATGLTDLDQKMGGLQSSDLIVLAGRPGMGKTSLATNIAFHIAKEYRTIPKPDGSLETVSGGVVGFFSLEMSAEQLATRIVSEQSGVSSSKIRRGDILESDFKKIAETAKQIQQIPLYIDQTGGLAIAQLVARARRLKRQKGLDLLVIDYIQLLSGSKTRSSDSRVNEITEITTTLKALAKELAVPIIALSQLSRQVESRDNKRPQLSDLRESGSIEQDADVVMFVYREAYYMAAQQPQNDPQKLIAWQAEMEKVEGVAEVIIAKQRHGPTCTVPVAFEAEITRFGNLAQVDHYPEAHF